MANLSSAQVVTVHGVDWKVEVREEKLKVVTMS